MCQMLVVCSSSSTSGPSQAPSTKDAVNVWWRLGRHATLVDPTPLWTVNDVTAEAVGRMVELDGVEVQRIVPGRGFFVASGAKSILVRPAGGEHGRIEPGQTVWSMASY